jgi:hypothetical protein
MTDSVQAFKHYKGVVYDQPSWNKGTLHQGNNIM